MINNPTHEMLILEKFEVDGYIIYVPAEYNFSLEDAPMNVKYISTFVATMADTSTTRDN